MRWEKAKALLRVSLPAVAGALSVGVQGAGLVHLSGVWTRHCGTLPATRLSIARKRHCTPCQRYMPSRCGPPAAPVPLSLTRRAPSIRGFFVMLSMPYPPQLCMMQTKGLEPGR